MQMELRLLPTQIGKLCWPSCEPFIQSPLSLPLQHFNSVRPTPLSIIFSELLQMDWGLLRESVSEGAGGGAGGTNCLPPSFHPPSLEHPKLERGRATPFRPFVNRQFALFTLLESFVWMSFWPRPPNRAGWIREFEGPNSSPSLFSQPLSHPLSVTPNL